MKRKEPGFKYNYILLIDDNELDNFINQKTIEATNFAKKIYVNSASKNALEFLHNIEISNTKEHNLFPEIIFVDINMPMIDGFQFIEKFIETYPEKLNTIKLALLTSSLNGQDKERAMAISKKILFLNKPLTPETLNQL